MCHRCHVRPGARRLYNDGRAFSLAGVQVKFVLTETFGCDECWAGFLAIMEKSGCPWCGEPVLDGEDSPAIPGVASHDGRWHRWHRECVERMAIGSLAHITGQCACYGEAGVDDLDPPGMTKREAARAAVAEYERRQREGMS